MMTGWTPRLGVAVALAAALAALPVSAWAQGTPEQQEACAPDAVRFCQATIPDIPKTTACMTAHFADLTPRCRTAFHAAVGGPAPADSKASDSKASGAKPAHSRVARREMPRPPRLEEAAPPPAASTPLAPGGPEAAIPDAPDLPDVTAVAPRVPMPDVNVTMPHVHVPGLNSYRASIADACHKGLIDPFTCRNTLHALSLSE